MDAQFEVHFADKAATALPTMTAAAQKTYPGGTMLHLAAGRECRLLLVADGQARVSGELLSDCGCCLLLPGKTAPFEFLTDCTLCEVSFQGAEALLSEQAFSKHGSSLLCSVSESERFLAAVSRAVTVPGGCVPQLYRSGLLLELLSCLPVAGEQEQTSDYGKQAMEYIRTHYMQPITVNDVAAAVGVSRSWLYRSFMDYAAQSPAMYLRDIRMQRARALLQRTDWPVQEIAQAVGFEDPLYFSRVFSAYEGCSPTAFRHYVF